MHAWLTKFFVLLVAAACGLGAGPAPAWAGPLAKAERIMVFAAASTTDVMTALGRAFSARTRIAVRHSFASSSTLAMQIGRGAPADVFVSANLKWMNHLDQKGRIVRPARFNLFGNRLVLIAPAQSGLTRLNLAPGLDLTRWLGRSGRLALGDPDHVPAGMYAREGLTRLGLWDRVKDRLARTANVRLALVLVARGEAPLGVVYATDAAITPQVKVVGVFPESSHAPIVYPVAKLTGRDRPAVRRYLEFLRSPEAAAIARRFGFGVRR